MLSDSGPESGIDFQGVVAVRAAVFVLRDL
jgi:hypothetical protein